MGFVFALARMRVCMYQACLIPLRQYSNLKFTLAATLVALEMPMSSSHSSGLMVTQRCG